MYRIRTQPLAKSKADAEKKAAATGGTGVVMNSFIEKLFELRDQQTKLMRNLRYHRNRMRYPVPEAAYAGKHMNITCDTV
jgi:hypothetical protein